MDPPPPTKPPIGFMDLPSELRFQVYEEWMRIDPPMIVAGGILEHTLLSLSPRPAPVGCPLFKILFYTVPLIIMPEGRLVSDRYRTLLFQLHDQVCGETSRHRIRLCFVDMWPVPGDFSRRKEYVKRRLLETAQCCRLPDVDARRHIGRLSDEVPEENSEMLCLSQSRSELELMWKPNNWQLMDSMMIIAVIIGAAVIGTSLGLFCTKLVLASIPHDGHDAEDVPAGMMLCTMFFLLGLINTMLAFVCVMGIIIIDDYTSWREKAIFERLLCPKKNVGFEKMVLLVDGALCYAYAGCARTMRAVRRDRRRKCT